MYDSGVQGGDFHNRCLRDSNISGVDWGDIATRALNGERREEKGGEDWILGDAELNRWGGVLKMGRAYQGRMRIKSQWDMRKIKSILYPSVSIFISPLQPLWMRE